VKQAAVQKDVGHQLPQIAVVSNAVGYQPEIGNERCAAGNRLELLQQKKPHSRR
jgi:hypothetical protein